MPITVCMLVGLADINKTMKKNVEAEENYLKAYQLEPQESLKKQIA